MKRTRRQHFIPQLLLKGFSSRTHKNKTLTYELHKARGVREASIREVACESWFYDVRGINAVEFIVSQQESRLAPLIDRLRTGQCEPQDKLSIGHFVSHLIVRTRNLRDTLTNHGQMALDLFYEELTNPANRDMFFRLARQQVLDDPKLKQLLRSLSQTQRQIILQQRVYPLLRSDELHDLVMLIFSSARSMLDLNEAARAAQAQVLTRSDALTARIQSLRNLAWSVHMFPPGSLVLGDIGPIAQLSTRDVWMNPACLTGDLFKTCLPIASTCLLVGSHSGPPQVIDLDQINLASAELSREVIFSAQSTAREARYRERIGSRSAFLTEAELAEAVRDGIRS